MAMLRLLVVLGMGAALLLPGRVGALPGPGESVPSFTAKDLLDTPHVSSEWRGQRTLLVVMTEQHAGDEMRRWFDGAAARLPEEVHRASIISLSLPFYVSTGMARGRAKEQVPRRFWADTWLDKNGKLADTFGLATSRQPYVLALDEQGRVLASLHGTVDAPGAEAIWSALSGPPEG
ncbi:hypothetical protein [Hyalangium rubrum]|uniref:Thioredoxin domain-containing protein n=1 Tax=Hyalangium rubrum TaxID=3103134 RepID=A0ABU5H7U7_9BACT|nr:hypothetical protein [Hyalangium sp. s54d21]MDY7228837.1 hypothetical protein [Hyalangium sp. s54d21]